MVYGKTLPGLGVTITLALSASSAGAAQALSTTNNTPFFSSRAIASAQWTSRRFDPPANQFGDILSTSSVDSRSLFVLIDDGGTDTGGQALWRNHLDRITGTPGRLRFMRVGTMPPPATWVQITRDPTLWRGAVGSFYSMGFAVVQGVFYATQANDWDWKDNGPFNGLAGIAYSTDQGKHWQAPAKPFLGATGNLNFVQYSSEGAASGDWVYAIATEREFNASTLFLGRAPDTISGITDPAQWQWAEGGPAAVGGEPQWTSSISQAAPILTWTDHITYPRMSYDAGLGRYLLTFTYSYSDTPPGIWQNGSELVVLESAQPWGPFQFVARQPWFGPTNGYDPALPENWISPTGTSVWMIWAANFDGCARGLDCSGAYGFNYRQLNLTPAGRAARPTRPRHIARLTPRRVPPRRPGHRAPHVYIAPAPSRRPLLHEGPWLEA